MQTISRTSLMVNLVTAAAVSAAAITAGPAPAAAGGKDVAKGAALIALLAVGAALVQQNQAARAAPRPMTPAPEPQYFLPAPAEPAYRPAPVAPAYRPTPVARSPRPVANPGWRDDRWQTSPAALDDYAPRIPAVCAVEIDGRRPATIYADTCLAREGFAHALPQHCAQTVRSQDWSGRIYDGACLRDAGYRTDRRW